MTRVLRGALAVTLTLALAACSHFQTSSAGSWQHPMYLGKREMLIQAVDRQSLQPGWSKDRTYSNHQTNRLVYSPPHGGSRYAINLRFVESSEGQPRTIVYVACAPAQGWAGYRTCRELVTTVLRSLATALPTEEPYIWQKP